MDKAYYALSEIEEKFTVSREDLGYFLRHLDVKLSVYLIGTQLERGFIYENEHCIARLPEEILILEDLQDLHLQNSLELLRTGTVIVSSFQEREFDYCSITGPEEGVQIRLEDVVIRKEEVDRMIRQGNVKTSSEISL